VGGPPPQRTNESPCSSRRGSFPRTVEDYTARKLFKEAHQALDEWDWEFPTDKLVGYSSLLRARLALAEAEKAETDKYPDEERKQAGLKLAKASNYSNAGTFEFLVDRDENCYFIEANTRLQVEHPVTEMITGVDLVKEQIRIAFGERLSLRQKYIEFKGVAIECRINAEDPSNGFSPCPGLITEYNAPGGPGVRVDTHVHCGYEIPPHYDALIGKLIVHKETRDEAIACMRRALQEFVIEGIKTTIPLYLDVFGHSH
jgi:biotin carboxylase